MNQRRALEDDSLTDWSLEASAVAAAVVWSGHADGRSSPGALQHSVGLLPV